MTEREFWACSLRYLMNLAEGHERTNRVRFEAGRLGGAISLLNNMGEGDTLELPSVYPFPWEEKPIKNKKLELTPELLEMALKFDRETPHPDTWAQLPN